MKKKQMSDMYCRQLHAKGTVIVKVIAGKITTVVVEVIDESTVEIMNAEGKGVSQNQVVLNWLSVAEEGMTIIDMMTDMKQINMNSVRVEENVTIGMNTIGIRSTMM